MCLRDMRVLLRRTTDALLYVVAGVIAPRYLGNSCATAVQSAKSQARGDSVMLRRLDGHIAAGKELVRGRASREAEHRPGDITRCLFRPPRF